MTEETLKTHAHARRKAHFESGGSPGTWRGRAAKLDESNSKAQTSKFACRRFKRGKQAGENEWNFDE